MLLEFPSSWVDCKYIYIYDILSSRSLEFLYVRILVTWNLDLV